MTEHLQFTISSELKSIIGRDLITDDFIAIFELVKNAYDAKAKKVTLIFENTKEKSEKSRIVVIDDGYGMSRKDIDDKWLLVGYSWKREQEGEPQAIHEDYRDKIGDERFFAGAKGIGRFSCDRLGSKLKLYTKTENKEDIHVLEMDWNKFEKDPKKDFQTIDVNYYTARKLPAGFDLEKLGKGTVLEISSLRSEWDRDKLIRLKRHLQRLINPAQVSPEQEFQIYLKAEEFLEDDKKEKDDHRIVNGFVRNIVFEKLEIQTTQLVSKIDKEGKKICTELHDKGEFIYNIEEDNKYSPLHNISIKLFYLNPVAKRAFTRIMGIQPVRYGSVFFYKNGIKINPYGNAGDDWLGLDRRKTQGTRRHLGNRDVMGRIEVAGKQPSFKEVSSRDGGVVKTAELELLRECFNDKALKRLEKYVVEGINWDSEKKPKDSDQIKVDSFRLINKLIDSAEDSGTKVEFNENLLDIYANKQIDKTPQLLKNIDYLKNHIQTKEAKAYVDLQTKAVRSAFKNLRKKQGELEKELAQKSLFIGRIGEERLEIQILDHQISLGADVIKGRLEPLKNRIEKGEHISSSELNSIIDVILLHVEMMSQIASFVSRANLENLENFNLWSQEIDGDMVEFIKQYVEKVYVPSYEKALDRERVTIGVKCQPNIEFRRNFNPFKFRVVIDNLISNSRKAKATHIFIRMDVPEENTLELRIKDDGVGVSNEDVKRIFSFGFSKTGGSGIGLYQVKKIMDDYGSVTVNNHLEKGVEFIIKVVK
jgi:signal transduction histidine kinase